MCRRKTMLFFFKKYMTAENCLRFKISFWEEKGKKKGCQEIKDPYFVKHQISRRMIN